TCCVSVLIMRLTLHFNFFFALVLAPLIATLFPYTTLFRSYPRWRFHWRGDGRLHGIDTATDSRRFAWDRRGGLLVDQRHAAGERSEEHTSELQSRENIVCRLLLEKKKS